MTSVSSLASASLGDRLIIYDNHLKECIRRNCSSPESLARFSQRQPPYLSLFGWDCKAECRIQSQWATLERLLSPSAKAEVAAKLPQGVPQFYGKVEGDQLILYNLLIFNIFSVDLLPVGRNPGASLLRFLHPQLCFKPLRLAKISRGGGQRW